jgi:hypothetical protein
MNPENVVVGEPPPPATRKRKAKRKLVTKPAPDAPGKVVSELVSVVKVSLASVVRRAEFRALLERVVVAVNHMTKRVSMLAKELLLAKLGAGETLPTLNQGFYSALYTSLRSGKWTHGHPALLAKRRVADPGLGSVMTQAMALAAKKLAAEVNTHYRKHYERFFRRWGRVCCDASADDKEAETKANGDRQAFLLDPDDTQLGALVQAAWRMRRDLEDREARGFALFPETSAKVSYVTLDAACVAYLYRLLHPQSFRVPGKKPGSTRAKPINDVAMEHGPEIFAELFDLPKVHKLRRTHHFRYSLQTDGVGVALSYGRWVHSVRKPKNKSHQNATEGQPPPAKRRKKSSSASSASATRRAVGELRPGYAYGAAHKTLETLGDLRGVTVRAADPGVRRTYTSVDLLTEEKDVRDSVLTMRSRTWQARTRARAHGARMKRWHDAELGEVQGRLNATPFRTSAYASKYGRYVDATLREWDALWRFAAQRKVRKLRFRAAVDGQSTLDREVDRLCAPRQGDTHTLLLYGNGASTNLFGKTKKNVKGPARKLFDTAVRRKKAVCVWADEFRTSKLDVYGQPVVHPRETRADRLRPPPCKAERHATDALGCRCFCAHSQGCARKRTRARWCADHFKPQLRYDVCYSNRSTPSASQEEEEGQHEHRMWNRDVVGALNIGCLFLAQALGLDPALWRRGTTAVTDGSRKGTPTSPLPWAEIFGRAGHALPFSLPTASPPARGP